MHLSSTDVLITGASRSGTSLTCRLLNQLPNTVALIGPIKLRRFSHLNGEEIAGAIARWFERERERIHASGMATTRHVDGLLFDNGFAAERGGGAGRSKVARRGRVRIDKPLDAHFTLCAKNDPGFTALLPALADRFRCLAIVRNPLSILASWNSLDHPLRDGHSPAERFDASLAHTLDTLPDRLDRQITLLDWFFDRYRRWLDPTRVVRYEEIIETRGKVLEAIHPAAGTLDEPLENRNANPVYDRSLMIAIGERLLARDGAFWHFYSQSSVESLLHSACRQEPAS